MQEGTVAIMNMNGRQQRTHLIEACLVILVAGGFLSYVVATQTLKHQRFAKECADAGIERMVQPPSYDDELGSLYRACYRAWGLMGR